jgi:hypothetical protein
MTEKLRALALSAKPWQMDTAGQTDEQQEEGTASVGVMNGDGEFLAVATVDTGLYDMPALALPLAEFIAEANPTNILALLDEIDRLKAENAGLLDALENLIEAADSMQGTYGRLFGKTPEDDDTFIHEQWAEEFLSERSNEARKAIDAAKEKP